MRINLSSEGVRIPIWISTLLVAIIIPAIIGALGESPEWKLIAIQALVSASILLGGGEVARKAVYSADTVASIEDNAYGVGELQGYSAGYTDGEAGNIV